MAAAAFPVAFLLFLIPLPDALTQWLETASKLASAEAAAMSQNPMLVGVNLWASTTVRQTTIRPDSALACKLERLA
jgi:hypothetical protein